MLKHLGFKWVGLRFIYACQKRLKWLVLTTPRKEWKQIKIRYGIKITAHELKSLVHDRSFQDYHNLVHSYKSEVFGVNPKTPWESPIQEADDILNGTWKFYGHKKIKAGFPPDWHKNYITGERVVSNIHWSKIGDFSNGDIKNIWELNRFSWVYPLVRAYWYSGDPKYPAGFWSLLEDWINENPPNSGVNWKCGQEITFRLMALCFARFGFTGFKPNRIGWKEVENIFYVSAHRIVKNISYALSQNNNHGISECIGLVMTALLYPRFLKSQLWMRCGITHLRRQIEDLVYEDGSFSQHSTNYHRVLLHDLVWIAQLLRLSGKGSPAWLDNAIKRAGEWIFQVMDFESGAVPCYGPNDGSNILPLTSCKYWDFRPVLSLSFACVERAVIPPGPWNEALFWMGLNNSQNGKSALNQSDLSAESGGYYTLRNTAGFLFAR